ncbi:hypothetical protein ACWGH3_04640 [Streptomyces sp. NPDC054884]|uniref:hypothetical protein n=1 Tax=Streptomyces sp. ME08-AFT2 TaxID=3028683 RepID=UPI0029ACEA1D|nr:hypothetical protein [Streptomyces sp. ME08-AFT2]MDX3308364.1 hypothetical protein [Streptomyces sp. ME08-AFT2]
MASPPGDGDHDGSPAEPLPLPPSGPLSVVCGRCGTRAAEPPPVTWTCSLENGLRRHFCEDCARENLRAIEGRLDSEWW